MKPLIVHREARDELEEDAEFYERRREGLGKELSDEIAGLLSSIQSSPELGTPYRQTGFRFRVARRFPYVIYYLEDPDTIFVAAIAHERRRPDYWRRRKPE